MQGSKTCCNDFTLVPQIFYIELNPGGGDFIICFRFEYIWNSFGRAIFHLRNPILMRTNKLSEDEKKGRAVTQPDTKLFIAGKGFK